MNIKSAVMFLAIVLIVSVVFTFLASANVWDGAAYAAPGANIEVLRFNLTNNDTTPTVVGGELYNLTIDLHYLSTLAGTNIINVTLINITTGTVIAYNNSSAGLSFPVFLNVSPTISILTGGDGEKYSIHFTLNSSAPASAAHGLTFGANIIAISAGTNVTYSPLPINNTVLTAVDRYTAIQFINANTTPNASYLNQDWISANASTIGLETGLGVKNITIYLYNMTGLVNNTSSTATTSLYLNFTDNTGAPISLLEGRYFLNATTYDNPSDNGINNYNSTPTYTIVLDRTAPLVDFNDTATMPSGIYARYIIVAANYTELNPRNVTFNVYNSTGNLVNNTTITTLAPGTGTTMPVSISNGFENNATYMFNITMFDMVNLSNSTTTTRNITFDGVTPAISYNSSTTDASNTYRTAGWIRVGVNASDNIGIKNVTIFLYKGGTLVNNTTIEFPQGQPPQTVLNNFSLNFTNGSSGLTDGVYYFNATVYDLTQVDPISTATRSVTIDNGAPSISISNPTAGGVFGTTDVNLTFTAIDATDTILLCNRTVDGTTTQIGSVGNGTANTTTMTSLAAGSHTVSVTCADNTGNSASSSTVTFYVRDYYVSGVTFDPSAPYSISTITATVSVYSGAPSERLRVTATESGTLLAADYIDSSSVGSNSISLSLGSLSVGTHTIVFNVSNTSYTEINGGNNEYSSTLSVSSLVTGSRTITSSASSTSAAATTNRVSTGQTVSYDLSKAANLTIKGLDVVFANALTGVTINVMNIASPPESTPTPSGVVYGYVKVEKTGVTDKDISSTTIHAKVSKKWAIDNNIDPDKVSVLRLENNTWSKLTTTKASEDDSYIYYDATSPGLSVFAITGEIKTAAAPAPEKPVEKPTEKVTPPAADYTWLIIIVVIIIIAAAGYYLYSQGYFSKKK